MSAAAEPSRRRVALTLRFYRALAHAFPQEFRNVYADEMVLAAEESIGDIARRHGIPGLLHLLADIAFRIPVEYLAEFRRDVRYGFRALAGSPGFTAVALVSLTLGIGVATASFSEMNGFVLRDVPGIANPASLVLFQRPVSYPDYKRYRVRDDLFSSTLA